MSSIDPWAAAEKVAVAFGLGSAWLERGRNVLLYPLGIISVLIYIVLCYRDGIYADMLINVYYFVMSIYGWWAWSKKADAAYHVPITRNSVEANLRYALITAVIWGVLYLWLKKYTDSTIPIIDSFTTALSVVGMVLMAERKIENWIYWIIADSISIPMFYYKGLELTAVLFFVFCLISVSGLRLWRKNLLLQT